MSTSLEGIHEILNHKNIQNEIVNDDEYVAIDSATEIYMNNDGKHGILIIIAVEENGEFIKIIAPSLYENSDSSHHFPILQTCMDITKHIKMIQCYYDESDGEVRIQIDIPLEDQNLSEKQLIRALSCIVETVDSFDKAFRSAIEKGEVNTVNVIDKRRKIIRIVGLMKMATTADLDQFIQQLEFTNAAPSGSLKLVKH